MNRYQVFFTPDADAEILECYKWGVKFWGEDSAQLWLRELYASVFECLTTFPLSCQIAPESSETGSVIRQYLVRRYRVLFEVSYHTVIVLHIAGPYAAQDETIEDSD